MATGVLGQAGQTARGPATVEHVYVIDFATVHPRCMEERSVKEKDFWKKLATRNPVLVSIPKEYVRHIDHVYRPGGLEYKKGRGARRLA